MPAWAILKVPNDLTFKSCTLLVEQDSCHLLTSLRTLEMVQVFSFVCFPNSIFL